MLEKLITIIREKAAAGDAESSYSCKMLEAGEARIAKKFGEESVEVVIAALAESREQFIYESADMIYHFLLLLESKKVDIEEIYQELLKRNSKLRP